jgi:uncharacterized protein
MPGRAAADSYTAPMKARDFDPLRLDVAAFAEAGARLEGHWPLVDLTRLAESAVDEGDAGGEPVRWSVRGEARPMRGGPAQAWLHVAATARLALQCQRCLQPVAATVAAERSFLFVPGEETAAALDAESEDDVLALTRSLDLKELVEDELLLNLPLVPKHDDCMAPLTPAGAAEVEPEPAPHPFAALAALKGGSRPN